MGAAYITPFQISRDFTRTVSRFSETHHAEININAITSGVAKDILKDRLALGLSVNYWIFKEDYQFTTANPNGSPPNLAGNSKSNVQSGYQQKINAYAVSVQGGMLWKAAPWMKVGLMVQPETVAGFDPQDNDPPLPRGVTWFRDVKVPARAALGVAFFPHPKWTLHVESDYVRRTQGTVLVGEGFFSGFQGLPEGRFDVIDARWGTEYHLLQWHNLKTWLWGGGYYETTRTEGAFSRYHKTMGIQFNPWIIKFGLAYDYAKFYENLGFDFDVDAERMLGWVGVHI